MNRLEGAPPFWMEEHPGQDVQLRLALVGELDVATADDLGSRLRRLAQDGYSVTLDLTRLEFIDSSGLRELITALGESRRDGWQLSIGTEMTHQVARVIELSGVRPLLWPEP